MYAVLKAGSGVTAGTIDVGFALYELKIRASVAAVVKINGQNVALAVTSEYQSFKVNADEFTVVSGTIDYVAIG